MDYLLRSQFTNSSATEKTFTDEQSAIIAYDQEILLPNRLGSILIKDETPQKLWQPSTRTWSDNGFFVCTVA